VKINELDTYFTVAWQYVWAFDYCEYRYGQALFNVLPKEFTEKFWATKDDFYYYHNSRWQEINEICFKYCDDYVGE
jgi:hypothetical protein